MSKEIITQEQLDLIKSLTPVDEDSYSRIQLPKIGMFSKDVLEETGTGKSKKIELISPAGEFYIEAEGEKDEEGKRTFNKTPIEGESLDVVIFYNRKKLSMWDDSTKVYTKTPLYDSKDEVLPLFEGKNKIATATPAELQAMYPSLSLKGNPTSKLKEVTVLYVLYNGLPYEFELGMSSKYEFLTYKSSVVLPQMVTTLTPSEDRTVGSNTYKAVLFKSNGTINAEQGNLVIEAITSMTDIISSQKAHFARATPQTPLAAIEFKVPQQLTDGNAF